MQQELPPSTIHGWQSCRVCHPHNQEVSVEGNWHLRANPGYWGNKAPKILVLGFSKGANQIAAAEAGEFDKVAFAGMRHRLQRILEILDLSLDGQNIDQALTAKSRVLGGASLVRCGLSVMENGKLKTSGTIMTKALKTALPRRAMETCIQRHLFRLPESVRVVVLLGTTETYIKGVKDLMHRQYADYQNINAVAFRAQGCTWVFAAHPSPANGTFEQWCKGDSSTTAGRNRELARQALGSPVESAGATSAATSTMPDKVMPESLDMLKGNRMPATGAPSTNEKRFSRSFHLVRNDGRIVVPVRMQNRETGRLAFRVARMGNTKADTIEITDENELLQLCQSGQYLVRVQPLDKSTPPGLVRPLLKHRIVKGPAA